MTQSRAHNRQSRLHEPAPVLTGAQAVIASLEAEGVELVFGYPGGSVLAIYDALYASPITHITARHEQGAVHEADGYARATGKVGVVLVTSGPGASNTVTGIATAYMDSVPLVIVTGQVPTTMIGTDAFQESDIMGMSMPVVKHSFLVKSAALLPETFRACKGKDHVTRFYLDPADLDKWMNQNKAEYTGDFVDGCLQDNFVVATKRGYAFIYEHVLNAWCSDFEVSFIPYKYDDSKLWAEWHQFCDRAERELA